MESFNSDTNIEEVSRLDVSEKLRSILDLLKKKYGCSDYYETKVNNQESDIAYTENIDEQIKLIKRTMFEEKFLRTIPMIKQIRPEYIIKTPHSSTIIKYWITNLPFISHMSRQFCYYPYTKYHPKLDKNYRDVCPIRSLPDIPNHVPILLTNLSLYNKINIPSKLDNYRTKEMKSLDYCLGVTIKTVLYELGSLDIWNMLMEGKICLSGSFILYLLRNFPNKDKLHDLKESDMDFYLMNKQNNIYLDGVPIKMNRHHIIHDIEKDNIAKGSFVDNEIYFESFKHGKTSYTYKRTVLSRKVNSSRFQNLPSKIDIVLCHFKESISNFDLSFLQNYYTMGKLYTWKPYSLISGVALYENSRHIYENRIEKYKSRGYTVEILNGQFKNGIEIHADRLMSSREVLGNLPDYTEIKVTDTKTIFIIKHNNTFNKTYKTETNIVKYLNMYYIDDAFIDLVSMLAKKVNATYS